MKALSLGGELVAKLVCFVGALGFCVLLPPAARAQSADLRAIVSQFYPQNLVEQAVQDGRQLVKEQCFAVVASDQAGPRILIAAYTDRYDGEVLVLRRTAAGFEIAAQAAGMFHFGQTCAAEAIDVNADGAKETHISFTSGRGTTDWIYGWDGQQLLYLTPVSTLDVPSGIAESQLINASFVDLNGDGLLEVYSFSQPPLDGTPGAPSQLFHLASGRYVLDRSIVWLMDFDRASGTPQTDEATIPLPAGAQAPFTLRIINGGGVAGGNRVENAVESGRVWLNDQQIAAPSDFGTQVATIQRTVALQAENTLKVRLAGAPGGRITIVIDAANWAP